ncbi:hypothetical protein J3R82DRAFT_3707 [Butyriboletus roseoflavus]|nr:hypothetical protein J3R82DRAFT_3707 [Butyriboletus roseoflavus]
MPAASHPDAIPSSSPSAFVCAMRHCVGVFQVLSPGDVDQVLVASCPPGTESTTLIDIHDASTSLSSATSSSDSDRNDVAKRHDAPTLGVVQLQAAFVWLHQLVIALVLQVVVIASDVVSLKDRITAVEGTQTPALVHGQETETLARQVSALCERVTSQQERIAGLERSHRAETDSYKKTIRELAIKLDDMKVDDDKKGREDVLEDMCQSLKGFQQSMECQAERITEIKVDSARKIALLQSELAGVQTDLAAVKTVAVPVNASFAS